MTMTNNQLQTKAILHNWTLTHILNNTIPMLWKMKQPPKLMKMSSICKQLWIITRADTNIIDEDEFDQLAKGNIRSRLCKTKTKLQTLKEDLLYL